MSSERMSDFSRGFAAAIRGVMKERGVTQLDLVEYLGRSKGYVSERISGKKPVDTDILDAVGALTRLDTVALVAEVTRRMAAGGDPSARRLADDDRSDPGAAGHAIGRALKARKRAGGKDPPESLGVTSMRGRPRGSSRRGRAGGARPR